MTKLQSFTFDKNKLSPVEIELTLWPGLPGIQCLGLPDQHLKESAIRIKSAIKQSGFDFPQSQQILVNLRPSHLKKTSKGLELAIACAYLQETGQISQDIPFDRLSVYGELTLEGKVLQPEDAFHLPLTDRSLLTGLDSSTRAVHFDRQVIQCLQDLVRPWRDIFQIKADESFLIPQRPRDSFVQMYSREQARLISILAVGEHSALLAGASGSGKSTLAKAVSAFLRAPEKNEFFNLKKVHREFGQEIEWRPLIKPHHSTPMMAMIGGGSVPFAGEVSRAHGGILILDELLEFSPQMQDSLREPFEEKKMRVFRSGKLVEYPAQVQFIATTNLCPCGDWTPQSGPISCRYSLKKCQSYSSKLSGPLVDRFEILYFHHGIGQLEVSGEQLWKQISRAQDFADSRQGAFKDFFHPNAVVLWENESFASQRRKMAVLKVARTLADLDCSQTMNGEHLKEALALCVMPFDRLKRWN